MFELVRWSTFAATAVLAVVGYSDQLRLILLNKSTEGLSLIMILLGFWSWASYALYGYFCRDNKIFWPNLLGTFLIGLILVSFFVY